LRHRREHPERDAQRTHRPGTTAIGACGLRRPGHGFGQARRRREEAGQTRPQILPVVQGVVDDLAEHGHPEEGVEVGVAPGGPDPLLAGDVQRDGGQGGQGQAGHGLPVGTGVVEGPRLPTDGRAPALQGPQTTEVLLDVHVQTEPLQAPPARPMVRVAQPLAIPHRIRARLEVEHGGQRAQLFPRHRPRRAKEVHRVQRHDGQDAQRRPRRRGEKERQAAEEAAHRRQAVKHGRAPLPEDSASGWARGRSLPG
jgi:hypothetical protein